VPQADRGERALDGVGRPQVLPVLGREVVEGGYRRLRSERRLRRLQPGFRRQWDGLPHLTWVRRSDQSLPKECHTLDHCHFPGRLGA
jgi:hypothetical protein